MTTTPKTSKRPRGRPPIDEGRRLIVRSIRLSEEQWAKLDALGMDWLRRMLDKAKNRHE